MNYLEHLAKLLGCQYLSDLRYRPATDGEAARILSEQEVFPLQDYIDAAEYILHSDPPNATSLSARQAIVDYLLSLR